MRINESVALVSGANRGIGRAFVEALLRHSSPVLQRYASAVIPWSRPCKVRCWAEALFAK
jgi:hypothetical protein